MNRNTPTAALAAAALALALAACGTPADGPPRDNSPAPAAVPAATQTINVITDPATIGAYSPPSANAKVGDVIEWTFTDLNPHTVSSDSSAPAMFDSGTLSAGKSFRFTVQAAGTYSYHCNIHPGMHGQLVVS